MKPKQVEIERELGSQEISYSVAAKPYGSEEAEMQPQQRGEQRKRCLGMCACLRLACGLWEFASKTSKD